MDYNKSASEYTGLSSTDAFTALPYSRRSNEKTRKLLERYNSKDHEALRRYEKLIVPKNFICGLLIDYFDTKTAKKLRAIDLILRNIQR